MTDDVIIMTDSDVICRLMREQLANNKNLAAKKNYFTPLVPHDLPNIGSEILLMTVP